MLSQDFNFDLVDFSAAIIYNFDIKGIYRFYYTEMRIQLIDYFQTYTSNG
jgi:hypothetical protein